MIDSSIDLGSHRRLVQFATCCGQTLSMSSATRRPPNISATTAYEDAPIFSGEFHLPILPPPSPPPLLVSACLPAYLPVCLLDFLLSYDRVSNRIMFPLVFFVLPIILHLIVSALFLQDWQFVGRFIFMRSHLIRFIF